MLDEIVGFDDFSWQQFELGVELSDAILRQKEEKVQAEQFVFVLRLWDEVLVVVVVALELRNVALEGLDVFGENAELSANLENVACDGKFL